MNWLGDDWDPQWRQAARDAEQIGAEHPDWTVRPVRRHQGPGVEACRDPAYGGVCVAIGTAAEVRAVLEHVPPGRMTARPEARVRCPAGR
jgi:hypothetical protein